MLTNRSIRVAPALLIAAGLFSCSAASTPPVDATASDDPVAGVVDGSEITLSALDEWIRQDLFEQQSGGSASKLYELREGAIERMINQQIFEAAVAKSGLSESEFMQQEIAAIGPVSEEDIAAFYELNKSGLAARGDLETLTPKIREYLEEQQPKQVIAKLREGVDVRVELDRPRIHVATTGPSQGPAGAPITIVEFSDYECPFCGRVEPTLQEVMKRYPGKVRLVYRHLPLSFHKNARGAAEASICAQGQGLFWEYHAVLFQNQKALGADDLRNYATQVGLDAEGFDRCVSDATTRARVAEDIREAREAGASGTPAFFVNGIPLSGAIPVSDFAEIIDAELARLGHAKDSAS